MILTGKQIEKAQEKGWIYISDWDPKRVNPNSYNLRLANKLAVYGAYQETDFELIKPVRIDMAKEIPLTIFEIPEDGYWLKPGILYLGQTMEYTETHKFVPMLEGRSSIGRVGTSIHVTAGFGDIGFCGYWTLEISCIQPVKIYPGIDICQIYYYTIAPDDKIWIPGDDDPNIIKYGSSGKYQKNNGIQSSMIWKELKHEN